MMRRIFGTLCTLLLAATFLAGCTAEGGDDISDDGAAFEDLGLEATATHGILRGVVIDEAIRPIDGATVTLKGEGVERETTTNAEGAFGFADLLPGSYIVEVSKNGYSAVQQSSDVVAGVRDPPPLKVGLTADPTTLAFVEERILRGFIDCSTPFIALCFAVDYLVDDVISEESQFHIPIERVPDWIQSEMVWQDTQSLNGEFNLMYSYGECSGGFYCDHDVKGPSPLLLTAGGDKAKEVTDVRGTQELYIRIFSGGLPEAQGLVGLSLQQDFEIVNHFFYGYTPTEGWRFTDDSQVPQPPA